MDAAGNIGLAFNTSGTAVYPSVRYTGRLVSDPLGMMDQGEASIIAGSGSQTSTYSRWGDYSMLAVDPVDGCTFWATLEYQEITGQCTVADSRRGVQVSELRHDDAKAFGADEPGCRSHLVVADQPRVDGHVQRRDRIHDRALRGRGLHEFQLHCHGRCRGHDL